MNTIAKMKMRDSNWWVSVLKGVLLVIFGIWLLNSPGENLIKLSLFFGLVIIIGGLLEVALALNFRKNNNNWGWSLASGVLDILIGAFLVSNPSFIFILITTVVSIWLLVRGVLMIRIAIMAKNVNNPNYVYNLVFGIIAIILALVFIWHPQILGITLAFWVALAFISFGIFRIILGLKMR